MFRRLVGFFKDLFNFNKQIVKEEVSSEVKQTAKSGISKLSEGVKQLNDDINKLNDKIEGNK